MSFQHTVAVGYWDGNDCQEMKIEDENLGRKSGQAILPRCHMHPLRSDGRSGGVGEIFEVCTGKCLSFAGVR